MKSHVRENYVKNATANLFREVNNADGSKTIIPNDFAKYLISERLVSNLIAKSWKLKDEEWSFTVETVGGIVFTVTGDSILDCIENANKKVGDAT